MKLKYRIILIIVLVLGLYLRFYKLDEIPFGIHADEASQGYNAFSLLETGKDMWGKRFPILFRANGSFQPPLYTYLTIIPIAIFGNGNLSLKFVSALSGTLLILITYFLIQKLSVGNEKKTTRGIIAALVVSLAPWAISFSRQALEANLVIPIFAFGILLLGISLVKKNAFIVSCLVLGLSTHAYYSERISSLLFLIAFLLVFRKKYIGRIKEIIVGIGILGILMLPHFYLLKTGALTDRFSQVSYLVNNEDKKIDIISQAKIVSEHFVEQYLSYFSLKNIFLKADNNLGRITDDMAVFYPWMLVPFLIGVSEVLKNRSKVLPRILLIGLIVTPIPAALTGDEFYLYRVGSFFWILTIIIALGIYRLWSLEKKRILATLPIIGLLFYNLFFFYHEYFVLSNYEIVGDNRYAFTKLLDALKDYGDMNIIIDNSRYWGVGIRAIYLMGIKPKIIQEKFSRQLNSPYYGQFNLKEKYEFNNISVRPVVWEKDLCLKNTIFVGDRFMAERGLVNDMSLEELFVINNNRNDPSLFGYISQNKNCEENKE